MAEVQVDADGTGAFTLSPRGAAVIPPGGREVATIEFQPGLEGVTQSRIRILSNDADEGVIDVVVRGEGVGLPSCRVTTAPASLDYGRVLQSTSFEVRFVAEADAAAHATSVEVRGSRGGRPSTYQVALAGRAAVVGSHIELRAGVEQGCSVRAGPLDPWADTRAWPSVPEASCRPSA